MTAEQDYIDLVVNQMPPATSLRSQIAMELKGLIAERTEHGQPMDEVLRQLGDPAKLAESYLAAVPLVAAPFWHRAAAKGIDVALFFVSLVPVGLFAWYFGNPFILLAEFLVVLAFCVYIVIAEWQTGQTLGKRLMGIRAVRESGARISVGQSIVRQLPVALHIFWIDVLFALFTDKKQRAFELLSKTRVVMAAQ